MKGDFGMSVENESTDGVERPNAYDYDTVDHPTRGEKIQAFFFDL